IGDRFLPDKAIDLVDEAAARIRMQIDSMPQEIDEIQRRMMQLQIERVSVAREEDAVSRERLAKIDAELAELSEKGDGLKARWQAPSGGAPRSRGSSRPRSRSSSTWKIDWGSASSARTTRFAPWPTRSGARGRASPIPTGPSARSCSSGRPAWARPSWPGRS